MSVTLAIAYRDFRAAFFSPLAYGLLSIFTCVAGFFFFNLLGSFNFAVAQEAQLPMGEISRTLNLNEWVVQGYFQTILLLLILVVPLVTMRVFVDERQHCTLLLLKSLPITPLNLFAGKVLANCGLLATMLALVFVLPLGLCWFSTPEVLPMVAGMIGLLCAACAFVTLGVAVACVANNALLSGVLTLGILLVLYGAHVPAESFGETGQYIFRYLSPLWQLRDLFRGVLTPMPFAYFSSLTILSTLVGGMFVFSAVRRS